MILRYAAAALVALAIPTSVSAATECPPAKVQRIWIGDGGMVWIFLAGGGPAPAISYNDPNREGALAAAMTAQSTGRSITIRFTADNVSCTNTVARYDFAGLYLESF
jgi:hypothetical protein